MVTHLCLLLIGRHHSANHWDATQSVCERRTNLARADKAIDFFFSRTFCRTICHLAESRDSIPLQSISALT
jgi:hypothetical protein